MFLNSAASIPPPIALRWYRLSVMILGLALAAVIALAVYLAVDSPTVPVVTTSDPQTADEGTWYEPQVPCWITNTCPRA